MATPTSQTLVGRETEIDRLVELLESPDAGSAVLLSGDAGVGKTRLLIELRDRAQERGWQVLAGHCLDFGESALPYLPFSEVVGRVAAADPELLARVAAEHPAITRLQPGRRTRAGADSEPAADIGTPTDRSDLFVAVQALLEAAAESAPLLLVIEDIHWADHSTRDMLGFLFARPFARPVRVIASYRSDDLHRRHPLRRQAAEWSRLPSLERLALGPLAEPAVRDLVGQLAPSGLAEQQIRGIIDRAEGNAFFVEELVASQGRAAVSADLADLLLVRLDPLSDQARQVVRSMSAAGRRVGHDLLAAVADLPAPDLEAAIRQAVEMNVLEAGPRHYSFRHALLAEAVYDDLLPGERVRLHGQYVAALTAGSAPGTAAELALHARRANDLDRAASASIEAGDEAMAVGGPDEAARHYEQALELLADPARAERLGVDLAKLATRAADALGLSGGTQRAAELLAAHLARLPAAGSSAEADLARARLLSQYAGWLTLIETDIDPLALSLEAAELAPTEQVPLRAKVLATHARVLHWGGRVEEAEAVAAEALALAERLAMPALASAVATTLGLLSGEGGDVRSALEKAAGRADAAEAPYEGLRARYLLARSYQDEGDWPQAIRWFESATRLGADSGLPWAPYAMEARWQLALICWLLGDWDRALEVAAPAASAPAIPAAIVEPVRLEILAARGEDVSPRLNHLRGVWPEEGGVAVYSAGVELLLATAHRDAAAAIAIYDDVVRVMRTIWTEHFGGRVRLAAQAAGAIAAALATAPASERERLAAEADRMLVDGEAVERAFRAGGRAWAAEGQAWSARLRAEVLRARWLADVGPPEREELLGAWRDALAAFERLGHVPETARVRSSYARVLRACGDAGAAEEQATAAAEVARRLGDRLLQADLDSQGAGQRAAGSGGAGRVSAGPAASAPTPARLTAREREILDLVAEGRSNGEIGRLLFISTKTVSVHVSNILGKLGASGRTEAAAIARREGLLG
ncbi:helix-turn-helix transcriptional regulator [Nocardioides sp. GY 10113]|uniref:helix-turn-helix transcriptional regulator n=1 Tax=Nocardioides sp. GY 10113 TaxID=2569761 RepID=UPI00145910C7|nr:helix-turn-helix transcriptional regulator [Nocardioides sp. GY 10113]